MENKNIIDKLDNIIELLEEEKIHKKSRIRQFLDNLIYGIGRGFGISIGMLVIGSIFLLILKELVSLPIIGEYIAKIVTIVERYLEEMK